MSSGPTRRQRPRWGDIRPLLGLEAPALSRHARIRRAATVDDLRDLARRRVPRAVFDYVDGAAEEEVSLARARAAFRRVEYPGWPPAAIGYWC